LSICSLGIGFLEFCQEVVAPYGCGSARFTKAEFPAVIVGSDADG
jgi:hypothetical protein